MIPECCAKAEVSFLELLLQLGWDPEGVGVRRVLVGAHIQGPVCIAGTRYKGGGETLERQTVGVHLHMCMCICMVLFVSHLHGFQGDQETALSKSSYIRNKICFKPEMVSH